MGASISATVHMKCKASGLIDHEALLSKTIGVSM